MSKALKNKTKLNDMVSVKDFGAVGDGVTDDTAAIQRAIDFVSALGGTVFFPVGTYYVSQLIYVAGITFQGVGAGSRMKKIPSADKFKRMFTQLSAQTFSSDSAIVAWRDLAFDGNSANASAYQSYELEQQHMIFLNANAAGVGRLRAIVDGCTFENCVADAVSVYCNVSLEISNCTMRECFRGGLVITGGYTHVKATNLHMSGTSDLTRMDIEIDGTGYGGTYATTLLINNIYTQNGFDISGSEMNAQLANIITDQGNTTFGGFGGKCDVRISNSTIALGVADTFENRITHAENLKFTNCQFIFKRAASVVGTKNFGLYVYWTTSGTGTVSFNGCEFYADSSVLAGDTAFAVWSTYNPNSEGKQIIVDNCRIESGFDLGVYNRGGTTLIRNTYIDAITPIRQDNSDASGWKMTVDNVSVGPTATKWIHIQTNNANGVFIHQNVMLDEAYNAITTDFGFTTNIYRGRRVILKDTAPTITTQGLIGDVVRLKTPVSAAVFEWVCTGFSGPDYVWKASTTLA